MEVWVQVTRKNPLLGELRTMKGKMDELYVESFGEERDESSCSGTRSETWQPLMDVWESEEEWLLLIDLPDVRAEELHVEVKENLLTVRGERCGQSLSEQYVNSQRERPDGPFFRTVELPFDIESENIRADFKQGVLAIRIPRNSSFSLAAHRIKVHRA
jgi:HSP20 family protein